MSEADRIVSSEAEELILVDRNDNVTGYLSKARAHDGGGILHRAFSLFLFDDAGRLLLQRRAEGKRLWSGYWSNSCCSHPRRGESMETATARRLHDELNISADLEFVYKFAYQAQFGDAGAENELCHVFLGRHSGDVRPNASEIDEVRFLAAGELNDEFDATPERFTPWFKLEWQALCEQYPAQLARYTQEG